MMAALLASVIPCAVQAEDTSSAIQIETSYPKYVLRLRAGAPTEDRRAVQPWSRRSAPWDGTSYISYPAGRPQITILKITIAPRTTMKWHSHPLPNAGYILSGELTIEKKDGTKQHFVAGQAVTETVNSVHRGITGAEPTVLIVFYPGTPRLPLFR